MLLPWVGWMTDRRGVRLAQIVTGLAFALGPIVLSVTEAGFGSYSPTVVVPAAIPTVALIFSLTADHRRRPIRRAGLVTAS